MEEHIVTARLEGENYTTKLKARQHEWTADEPTDLGGADKGPNAGELLAGALATCTSITLKMYAGRKEWPLDGIEVEVQHVGMRRRKDVENPEGDLFKRKIELKGDLSEDQRKRLLEIANKCPVHKTLSHTSEIHSSLV